MYVKTFKYPIDSSMVTLVKENVQTGQMDKTAYQLRLLQEAIVNKYVDVVKSETGITNNDIEINVESAVENETSYLIYSILFKSLSYAAVSAIDPKKFLANTTTPESQHKEEMEKKPTKLEVH